MSITQSVLNYLEGRKTPASTLVIAERIGQGNEPTRQVLKRLAKEGRVTVVGRAPSNGPGRPANLYLKA